MDIEEELNDVYAYSVHEDQERDAKQLHFLAVPFGALSRDETEGLSTNAHEVD